MGLPMTVEETAAGGVVPRPFHGRAAAQRRFGSRFDVPFARQLDGRFPRAGGQYRCVGRLHATTRAAMVIEVASSRHCAIAVPSPRTSAAPSVTPSSTSGRELRRFAAPLGRRRMLCARRKGGLEGRFDEEVESRGGISKGEYPRDAAGPVDRSPHREAQPRLFLRHGRRTTGSALVVDREIDTPGIAGLFVHVELWMCRDSSSSSRTREPLSRSLAMARRAHDPEAARRGGSWSRSVLDSSDGSLPRGTVVANGDRRKQAPERHRRELRVRDPGRHGTSPPRPRNARSVRLRGRL